MKQFLKFLIFILTLSPTIANSAIVEGTLEVRWGDRPNFDNYVLDLNLVQSNGDRIPLKIPQIMLYQAGGIQRLKGRSIIVSTSSNTNLPATPNSELNSPLEVESVSLSASNFENEVLSFESLAMPLSGSQRYVSIMCKFSDNSSEPQDINFFNNMYGNNPGQLGHYWKEVSSNKIDLTNSRAYGGQTGNAGWYTLPNNRSHYISSQGTADLDKLFDDCISEADSHIDFTNVKGINLMFNGLLDCCAWGGGRWANLDGVTKVWPTTWNPTWAWANVGVIAHEMGHSFGLPHSNNSDGDGDPYDSPWSVMSSASHYDYSVSDSIYGKRGQHTNAYEKNDLGWLNSTEILSLSQGFQGSYTANLHWLSSTSAGSGAYRTIIIPTTVTATHSKYYTVEARKKSGDYDAALPATAVIIHSVDTARNEPSWVVDAFSPANDYADSEGVIWLTGETFNDNSSGISIEILSENSDGFVVQISSSSSSKRLPWPLILDMIIYDGSEGL